MAITDINSTNNKLDYKTHIDIGDNDIVKKSDNQGTPGMLGQAGYLMEKKKYDKNKKAKVIFKPTITKEADANTKSASFAQRILNTYKTMTNYNSEIENTPEYMFINPKAINMVSRDERVSLVKKMYAEFLYMQGKLSDAAQENEYLENKILELKKNTENMTSEYNSEFDKQSGFIKSGIEKAGNYAQKKIGKNISLDSFVIDFKAIVDIAEFSFEDFQFNSDVVSGINDYLKNLNDAVTVLHSGNNASENGSPKGFETAIESYRSLNLDDKVSRMEQMSKKNMQQLLSWTNDTLSTNYENIGNRLAYHMKEIASNIDTPIDIALEKIRLVSVLYADSNGSIEKNLMPYKFSLKIKEDQTAEDKPATFSAKAYAINCECAQILLKSRMVSQFELLSEYESLKERKMTKRKTLGGDSVETFTHLANMVLKDVEPFIEKLKVATGDEKFGSETLDRIKKLYNPKPKYANNA